MSDQADLPARYGGRFFTAGVPETDLPEEGMAPRDALELINEEMALDGDPARNLATFVTTWMEPEARQVIAENLHRNFIDHAEYPRTAEIEQRCIAMIGRLYGAENPFGARCQGSSEAVMLAGLAAKWRWRKRREAAGEDATRPNLVYGRETHVVWDKLCRYFEIEPRTVPLQPGKYTIGPDDVEPLIDESTIAVVGVLGTTFTGHADDIAGIDALLARLRDERGLEVPMHVDAASGGFVWPFAFPEEAWDFRLPSVASINVSGHKFGMVYPGIGWLLLRSRAELPDDLVFTENYLGREDETFTLNFSTGSSMVLAQYYNLCRFGRSGYSEVIGAMAANAASLAADLTAEGWFELIGESEPQLPLVAFQLAAGDHPFDEFDVASSLAAQRGWMVPAYTLPPDAQDVKIMRALVRENLSHAAARTLASDLNEACEHLERSGGKHRPAPIKRGTGY